MLLRLTVIAGITLLAVSGAASAQDFPNRVMRIITTASGGFADISARLIAAGLSKRLDQSIIVDNRPGAVIALDTAVKASPDGHSLFLYGNGVWLAPFIYPDMKYDPLKELTPITLTTRVPYIIVVNPAVPAKSIAELIALAKSKPGELNYGAGNPSGTPSTAAALFTSMAGINIVNVPYKTTAPALNDVMAGRLQMMVSAASAMQHVKTGKLRALAVTSAEPTTLAPGLPTVAETLPGYEAVSTMALFVPAKTPAFILRRLNQEVVADLNDPATKKRYLDSGADVVPGTPQQAMAKAQSERQRLGKIVKDLGAGN